MGQALGKRFTSLAFFFAMMTGSAFYDSSFVNGCLEALGFSLTVSAQTMVKAPIFLTFLSSLVVLGAALGLRESASRENRFAWTAVRASLRKTKEAGSWIWSGALPFGIIMAAMVLDNVIRQFLTIASAYWNVIGLPLATFGLVASGMSLMGFFTPRLARLMAERNSPAANFFILSGILTLGLFGIGYAVPLWGILPAVLLYASMQALNYLVSRYLTEQAPSEQRATVLSFGDWPEPFLRGRVHPLLRPDRLDQGRGNRFPCLGQGNDQAGRGLRGGSGLVPLVFHRQLHSRRFPASPSFCKKTGLRALLA